MVATILRELRETSSRNGKLAILEQHRDNELLKTVFDAALNPYKSYYLRKIPDHSPQGGSDLATAIASLDALLRREVTGHAAIDHLRDLLNSLSDDDAMVLALVVQKDLDCGVQRSTVNKVWKGLIPEYPCLLASGFSDKSIANIEWPAYSQVKLDGMRANLFHEKDGSVHIRGRSGKPIDLLGAMDDIIRQVVPKGWVLDGELVLVEKDGSVMARKKGNGILNKAIKGTISERETRMVRATVWDIIPIDKFHKGRHKVEYRDRLSSLESLIDDSLELIRVVETRAVRDLNEAQAHFQEMLSTGEEGTILKNMEHHWENKRSKGLVKMKAERDADLVVVDWQEGTGKYEGMMGALICQSSDGKVEVSVGSGYSDAQRKEFTRDKTIGRVVTVLYNERIASLGREGVDSLFLPRFVELREDKNVANSSKEIL